MGGYGRGKGAGKASNQQETLSRSLVRLLRHEAPKQGVSLNREGWGRLAEVLALHSMRGWQTEDVKQLVNEQPQRLELWSDRTGEDWIRATGKHTCLGGKADDTARANSWHSWADAGTASSAPASGSDQTWGWNSQDAWQNWNGGSSAAGSGAHAKASATRSDDWRAPPDVAAANAPDHGGGRDAYAAAASEPAAPVDDRNNASWPSFAEAVANKAAAAPAASSLAFAAKAHAKPPPPRLPASALAPVPVVMPVKPAEGPMMVNMAADDTDDEVDQAEKEEEEAAKHAAAAAEEYAFVTTSSWHRRWTRYYDEAAGCWWNCDDEKQPKWFQENRSGTWSKYVDPDRRQPYWYDEETAEFFYVSG